MQPGSTRSGARLGEKTHGTIVPSLAARFAIDLAPHKWQGFVRQVESTVIQSDSGRIVFMK
jgi:hypothetical protein